MTILSCLCAPFRRFCCKEKYAKANQNMVSYYDGYVNGFVNAQDAGLKDQREKIYVVPRLFENNSGASSYESCFRSADRQFMDLSEETILENSIVASTNEPPEKLAKQPAYNPDYIQYIYYNGDGNL